MLILLRRTLRQILCDSALFHLECEILQLSLTLDPQHRRVAGFELSHRRPQLFDRCDGRAIQRVDYVARSKAGVDGIEIRRRSHFIKTHHAR